MKIDKEVKYQYRANILQEYCKTNKINPFVLMAKVIDKKNDAIRVDLAHEIGDSAEDYCSVLGVTERTYYRLVKTLE